MHQGQIANTFTSFVKRDSFSSYNCSLDFVGFCYKLPVRRRIITVCGYLEICVNLLVNMNSWASKEAVIHDVSL